MFRTAVLVELRKRISTKPPLSGIAPFVHLPERARHLASQYVDRMLKNLKADTRDSRVGPDPITALMDAVNPISAPFQKTAKFPGMTPHQLTVAVNRLWVSIAGPVSQGAGSCVVRNVYCVMCDE